MQKETIKNHLLNAFPGIPIREADNSFKINKQTLTQVELHMLRPVIESTYVSIKRSGTGLALIVSFG